MKTSIAKIPLLIGFLILLIAIPVSIFITTQKPPVSSRLEATEDNPLVFLFPQNVSTAKIGVEIPLTINLDTKGRTLNGVDITLRYNPLMFRIDQTHSQIGTIFTEYPRKVTVDQRVGLVTVSGRGTFKGKDMFVRLSLIPLSKGKGEILRESMSSQDLIFDYQGSVIEVTD
jgi:hypothetical protein